MNSIGETLRRERLRRNLDLDQISRELKISSRFLEAIEDERFDKLPAGVFARSFVRQYARLLELDEEELAAQVQRAVEPEPVPIKPVENWQPQVQEIHVPRVEEWEAVGGHDRFRWSASLPALALVVVVMLVCSGVYSFWQRTRHMTTARATAPTQTVQRPVPPQQAPAAQPPAQEPSAQAPAAQEPPKPAPTESSSAQQPASRLPEASPAAPPANSEAQREQNPAETPANPADQKPAEPSAANPNGTVRVELTADEPVWVLARADGKYLFSGTLEPKQTRVVEANGTLMLRLGNAGGVNITLNGKPIGTVGAKGQVRDVQFTSGGFHIVAAPKPSLPLVEEPI
jgi:cytoskeleton protein RodZ